MSKDKYAFQDKELIPAFHKFYDSHNDKLAGFMMCGLGKTEITAKSFPEFLKKKT